jgi:hypothetical protein
VNTTQSDVGGGSLVTAANEGYSGISRPWVGVFE